MNTAGVLYQILQSLLVVMAAPLLLGWVNACRAWLQNKKAPSVFQPYRALRKLFHKDAVLAENASWLFRFAPYVIFGCMWLAAGIVPVLAPLRVYSARSPRWISGRLSEPSARAAKC
jgi:formate hydrogenlyase subunit 4